MENYFCAPAKEWLPKVWLGKEVVTCSLIKEGFSVPPYANHVPDFKAAIVASSPLSGRRMENGVFYNAGMAYFPSVLGPTIGSLLVHWGNVPLFVVSKAPGLPITPNWGDIFISWQDTPPFICKLPDAGDVSVARAKQLELEVVSALNRISSKK